MTASTITAPGTARARRSPYRPGVGLAFCKHARGLSGLSYLRYRHISDTARRVASYRAIQSERPDTLFRDPYAKGSAFYADSMYSATAEAFSKARQIAEAIGETQLANRARFWHGAALHGVGQLREALSVWAVVLSASDAGALDPHVYMTFTRYLLVAIDLPSPLPAITKSSVGRLAPGPDGCTQG